MSAASNLLDVENLWVRFPTRTGIFDAVRGVSFSLGKERLGIVGESGSGKSMTGRAILRLIRKPGIVTADRIALDGDDIMAMSERQMRKVRGERISMIMQDPKFSLNPVMTVGDQIMEAYRLHATASKAETKTGTSGTRIRIPARSSGPLTGVSRVATTRKPALPKPRVSIPRLSRTLSASSAPTSPLKTASKWSSPANMNGRLTKPYSGRQLASVPKSLHTTSTVPSCTASAPWRRPAIWPEGKTSTATLPPVASATSSAKRCEATSTRWPGAR